MELRKRRERKGERIQVKTREGERRGKEVSWMVLGRSDEAL